MPTSLSTHRRNRYKVQGKVVPSVTTILSQFKDPGPLMYWSWETAYKQLEEAVHHLEEISTGEDIIGSPELRKAKTFLKTKPLEIGNYRSEALKEANAGTVAHKLVDMWIKNDKQTKKIIAQTTPRQLQIKERIDRQTADKALLAFAAFLAWIKQSRFEMEESEQRLVSEQYLFGGTIDCLGSIAGESNYILLDWKTSKALYADYLLQIAAYGILWEENWSPGIGSYHLLRFDKNTGDFQHLQFQDLSVEKEMFLLLRKCYGLLQQIKKRIK